MYDNLNVVQYLPKWYQSAGICLQIYNFVVNNDIRSKQIQEGECLAWVSSPVHTLAVWTSFNKAVKTK